MPPNFGNGKQPDKINSVMIYIDRKPPTITRDGIELDGVPQDGVPYYGEPVRGGVRIYLDDKLATIVKRQELDAKQAKQTPDGELHWSFADFLKSKGVDTSKIVEGWVIRDNRREEKIPWDQLSKMTFSAGAQAQGGILLGDGQGIRANAVALHTRAIKPDELPVIQPDERVVARELLAPLRSGCRPIASSIQAGRRGCTRSSMVRPARSRRPAFSPYVTVGRLGSQTGLAPWGLGSPRCGRATGHQHHHVTPLARSCWWHPAYGTTSPCTCCRTEHEHLHRSPEASHLRDCPGLSGAHRSARSRCFGDAGAPPPEVLSPMFHPGHIESLPCTCGAKRMAQHVLKEPPINNRPPTQGPKMNNRKLTVAMFAVTGLLPAAAQAEVRAPQVTKVIASSPSDFAPITTRERHDPGSPAPHRRGAAG